MIIQSLTKYQLFQSRRLTLLAMIGALGVALAVAPVPVVTRIIGTAPSASSAGIDTAGYSQVRVLEPGSRGSVVEI